MMRKRGELLFPFFLSFFFFFCGYVTRVENTREKKDSSCLIVFVCAHAFVLMCVCVEIELVCEYVCLCPERVKRVRLCVCL